MRAGNHNIRREFQISGRSYPGWMSHLAWVLWKSGGGLNENVTWLAHIFDITWCHCLGIYRRYGLLTKGRLKEWNGGNSALHGSKQQARWLEYKLKALTLTHKFEARDCFSFTNLRSYQWTLNEFESLSNHSENEGSHGIMWEIISIVTFVLAMKICGVPRTAITILIRAAVTTF